VFFVDSLSNIHRFVAYGVCFTLIVARRQTVHFAVANASFLLGTARPLAGGTI
jgi:hypothetical protein